MKIACFHLFSDYSGSPKVLFDILTGLRERDIDVDLTTSSGGVLSELSDHGVNCRNYRYTFSPNPVVTMWRYARVQCRTFISAFRYMRRADVVFYINTILPVGPALAARIMGKPIVYHYHENAFIKGRFYRGLAAVMQKVAARIICVSNYQASAMKHREKVTVIPNTLSADFLSKLRPDPVAAFQRKNVLMLSSLKEYKGTREFVEIASGMPQLKFTLVINDSQHEIDRWLAAQKIVPPKNLTIHPRSSDVTTFYNDASVVVNLSNPRLFIETFGLTAVEAMSCGLPVIVPPVGGIAEMVTDGINGFRIDCSDRKKICSALDSMLSDKGLYMKMAGEAMEFCRRFSRENMISAITTILKQCSE